MKTLLNLSEAQEIDRLTQVNYGLSGRILLEQAGAGLWDAFLRETKLLKKGSSKPASLVFLVGKGSNGGDALVMARTAGLRFPHLELRIFFWDGDAEQAHTELLRPLSALKVDFQPLIRAPEVEGLLKKADWVIDGLLGIGWKPPLRPAMVETLHWLNGLSLKVCALDLPTGLNEPGVGVFLKPQLTLCVGEFKTPCFRPAVFSQVGTLVRSHLDFPQEVIDQVNPQGHLLEKTDLKAILLPVTDTAYKSRRGRLEIYAGEKGTLGAGRLATSAGAASGVGWVCWNLEPELYPLGASFQDGPLVKVWENAEMTPADAYLAGSGWSAPADENFKTHGLRKLAESGLPTVWDAGALDFLKKQNLHDNLKPWVLTPHPGEWSRITGLSPQEIGEDPVPGLLEFSQRWGVVVVLKSHLSYVASPDGTWYLWAVPNPFLGVAGSGDVLAGAVAGLLARGHSAKSAAMAAVIVHGLAGRSAAKKSGWFTPQELTGEMAQILGKIQRSVRHGKRS